MSVKAIIKPVVEEIGKFGETAKEQVSGQDSQNAKEETKKVVEDIYKSQEETSPEQIVKQKAEDKKKEAHLRQILHQEYVQSAFNRAKPKEEPVAEKLENEKKIEEFEFQEKEAKKPPPLAIQRAQNIEKHRGSSG